MAMFLTPLSHIHHSLCQVLIPASAQASVAHNLAHILQQMITQAWQAVNTSAAPQHRSCIQIEQPIKASKSYMHEATERMDDTMADLYVPTMMDGVATAVVSSIGAGTVYAFPMKQQ